MIDWEIKDNGNGRQGIYDTTTRKQFVTELVAKCATIFLNKILKSIDKIYFEKLVIKSVHGT